MANDLSEESRKACHNCRRRRLKCDRALPQCLKCIKNGQQCLGYQRLIRWETGVASRGKLAGVSYHEVGKRYERQGDHQVVVHSLPTDPLTQDLDASTRNYLHHCKLFWHPSHSWHSPSYLHIVANDFCRNLVSYDNTQLNPFRELIPLTQKHPILLHIIVANSASWIHNASTSITTPSTGYPDGKCSVHLEDQESSMIAQSKPQYDALAAKRQALHLLQLALTGTIALDVDVTMAVVLLFIELELVEYGQGNWTHHISGARRIIERLCGPEIWTQTSTSTLRRCLISNCLV